VTRPAEPSGALEPVGATTREVFRFRRLKFARIKWDKGYELLLAATLLSRTIRGTVAPRGETEAGNAGKQPARDNPVEASK